MVAAADAGARTHTPTHSTTVLTVVECSRAAASINMSVHTMSTGRHVGIGSSACKYGYGGQNVLRVMYGNLVLTGRHTRHNSSACNNVVGMPGSTCVSTYRLMSPSQNRAYSTYRSTCVDSHVSWHTSLIYVRRAGLKSSVRPHAACGHFLKKCSRMKKKCGECGENQRKTVQFFFKYYMGVFNSFKEFFFVHL